MLHHEASIAHFVRRVRERSEVVGVVLTGSVARGTERPDSDVDLQLVLTEPAFDAAWRLNTLSYTEREGITYEGGYFDIKVASPDFLQRAAAEADEPMRAYLAGARVLWSRLESLAGLVQSVVTVPESFWHGRMASQIAQLRLHADYFLAQADETGNVHLLHHAAVHAVTAGSRALLALNRVLFQGHKYLEKAVAGLDRVPADHAQVAADLLDRPTRASALAYLQMMESFHDWPLPREQTLSTFVRDNELAWFSRTLPPEYS